MFSKVGDFKVFNEDFNTCIEYILEKAKEEKVHIVSGNPEVMTIGANNDLLNKDFKSSNSIIIPDGVGLILASKICKEPVLEKIAGIEVMQAILSKLEKTDKSIYLLGTTEEIIVDTYKNIQVKYPELNICGYHNGFFDMNNCDDLIDNINEKKPYAIFVAMGCPRQETFIIKYKEKLGANIFMGVGGSFDVISGRTKRAPKFMINLKLEWLYRVLKEPFRIKRLVVIPKYLFSVIKGR